MVILNVSNGNYTSFVKLEAMNVLELYSGIGGMYMALEESKVSGQVLASIEINPTANAIYKHNYPNVNLLNANIEGLTASFIKRLNINTILMSPPCQPFTRNGLKNDVNDSRNASFQHVLKLLHEVNIKYILIENVKGFETSLMHKMLLETLLLTNYTVQEVLLNPKEFGVPNSRLRYYCLAKKSPHTFPFQSGELMEQFPVKMATKECFPISDIIEEEVDDKYFLSDNILKKRANILDICYKDSKRSCCFTKAYGRFIEGTGSVYTDREESYVHEIFKLTKVLEADSDEKLSLLRSMNLRFFTPKEICRLMCFPSKFSFPSTITDRQKYMVLGNSINVKVVSELIKLLDS